MSKFPEGWSFDDKGWKSENALNKYLKSVFKRKESLGSFDSREALETYIKMIIEGGNYTNKEFAYEMEKLSKSVSKKVLQEVLMKYL